jgi:hypothetical protein
MHDPHVQAMHYKVSSGGGVSYVNPEPMSFSNHLGTFDLSDGKLRIVPSEHFPDENSSRQAIRPFLEEWEMEVHLTSDIPMLRFEFDRVELIDRAPPPPPVVHSGAASTAEAGSVSLGARSIAVARGSASPHCTCSKYPEPPKTFRATTEVQHAYRRWLSYRSHSAIQGRFGFGASGDWSGSPLWTAVSYEAVLRISTDSGIHRRPRRDEPAGR